MRLAVQLTPLQKRLIAYPVLIAAGVLAYLGASWRRSRWIPALDLRSPHYHAESTASRATTRNPRRRTALHELGIIFDIVDQLIHLLG